MSNFKRENKYLTLKLDDIDKHLTPEQRQSLECIVEDICDGRGKEGKPLKKYVCENWPMYEDTWKAIENYCDEASFRCVSRIG